jgi:hypothetical protein
LSSRRAARLLLLLLAAVLAALALGAPRFTWANEGVVIDHPRSQPAAALAAALSLGAAAWRARPRFWMAAAGLGALALALLAAQQAAFRLDAVEAGVRKRSLSGIAGLSWSDIEAVEPRDGSITLRARAGQTLVIATTRFAPDERVRLERTIARRVKDATR